MTAAGELTDFDATGLAGLIAAGEATAERVVRAHLERIEALDPSINAFVTVNAEAALRAARSPLPGPLSGVPITVKDSIDTAGLRTARGSRMYADRVPDADATAVARLRAAGAILIGKTNLPELSYWTETDNLLTGRTRNPHDPERVPGGSSGGESAAIAARMSPLGLGSDVGISVRGPAHDTGIAAIKPTHGRVPCTGLYPQVMLGFWHIGPMARSVRDLRLALRLVEGPDGVDPWSVVPAGTGRPRAAGALRVADLSDALGPVDPEVRRVLTAAAAALTGLGARVEVPATPWLDVDDALTSATLFSAEMVPFTRAEVERHHIAEEDLHATTRAVLATPEPTARQYQDARARVEELRRGFTGLFVDHDVALAPVCPVPARLPGRRTFRVGDLDVPARDVLRATVPFNLTGLPAVSLPFGHASHTGLPIGVQLIGPWFGDEYLLDVAADLEPAADPAPRLA